MVTPLRHMNWIIRKGEAHWTEGKALADKPSAGHALHHQCCFGLLGSDPCCFILYGIGIILVQPPASQHLQENLHNVVLSCVRSTSTPSWPSLSSSLARAHAGDVQRGYYPMGE